MTTKSTIKQTILGLTLLFSATLAGQAQTSADSMALATAKWDTLTNTKGLLARTAKLSMFNRAQQIACIEIDPGKYNLEIVQFDKRTTVGKASRQDSRTVAAINGGFFHTDTKKAIANDFIKMKGQVYCPISGNIGCWGSGAIAFDAANKPHFAIWNRSTADSVWQASYDNVMVAGPLLILDGNNFFPWSDSNDLHPRSFIGARADGTILMVTVDGRQPGADGMSLQDLSFVSEQLGLISSLNLDGGGSTTLWTQGKGVINSPSDDLILFRLPRSVGNMIRATRK